MASIPNAAVYAPDTHAKALAINLDGSIYGTLAEIGAGQEVARWFLQVGAASGTVAQTVSAYDKLVSDAIYGTGTRYVSKERLLAMLDHEYRQVLERLGPTRGAATKFFAFADTASARNYAGDNEQHAWIGLRFQVEPRGEPNDVILHVNLLDPTNLRQQQALGILGVNLIHALHYHRAATDEFLTALWAELSLRRLEIDSLEISGPAMVHLDSRRCALAALRSGMSRALVFDSTSQIVEPANVLRKRPIVVNRGRFAPFEPVHGEMLTAAEKHLRTEFVDLDREPVRVLEMSLNPVGGGGPDDDEVLDRIPSLVKHGVVIVSSFAEGYLLVEYLRHYTSAPIRFVMGVSLLARILEDRFYEELPGRLLEGLGKFLAVNAKVYAYPMPLDAVHRALGSVADRFGIDSTHSGLITADDIHPQPPIDHLFRYLREGGWVIPMEVT